MAGKRLWCELTPDEQLRLREAFGHYLDQLPTTCSLDGKLTRFQQWLSERDIEFSESDLKR